MIETLAKRWSLTLGDPIVSESSWVAPATRADGTAAFLKIGKPHMEAEHEIAGLRFWNGDPTVRLLEADEDLNAMLLERGEPGTPLSLLPEGEQDIVLARLLKRLWRRPVEPHPFRPLSALMDSWKIEARNLDVLDQLERTAPSGVLLATDLHAGNVLRAQREPWLAIDPKPFIGDPAFDAVQHLLNCRRMRSDPTGTIDRFSKLLDLDPERVSAWYRVRTAIGAPL